MKKRLAITLVAAFAVICTSACVYINVKDLPEHEDMEVVEFRHDVPAEEIMELEILRDQIHALERENAELSEHIEALEMALDKTMHRERDDDMEAKHHYEHEEHDNRHEHDEHE